jgi:hypothetical protein
MREMRTMMPTESEKLAAAEDTILQLRYITDRWLERMKPYTILQYGKRDILKAKEILDQYASVARSAQGQRDDG